MNFFRREYIKAIRKLRPEFTEPEKKIQKIIQGILSDPKTVIQIAQKPRIAYLQSYDEKWNIEISEVAVKLSNHVFTIENYTNPNFGEKMIALVYKELDRRCLEQSNKIFKNRLDTLDRIINEVHAKYDLTTSVYHDTIAETSEVK